MDNRLLDDRLDRIDQLITDYLAADATIEPKVLFPEDVDIEEMLEHGAFPPSDPRSPSGKALLSMARKLQEEGGKPLLADVLDAYREKFGAKRAATLNVRWHYLAE